MLPESTQLSTREKTLTELQHLDGCVRLTKASISSAACEAKHENIVMHEGKAYSDQHRTHLFRSKAFSPCSSSLKRTKAWPVGRPERIVEQIRVGLIS